MTLTVNHEHHNSQLSLDFNDSITWVKVKGLLVPTSNNKYILKSSSKNKYLVKFNNFNEEAYQIYGYRYVVVRGYLDTHDNELNVISIRPINFLQKVWPDDELSLPFDN